MKRKDFLKTLGFGVGALMIPLPTGLQETVQSSSNPTLNGGIATNMKLYQPYEQSLDTLVELLSMEMNVGNSVVHEWQENDYL